MNIRTTLPHHSFETNVSRSDGQDNRMCGDELFVMQLIKLRGVPCTDLSSSDLLSAVSYLAGHLGTHNISLPR